MDYDAYDYNYQYNDGGDYNYDLGGDSLAYNKPEIRQDHIYIWWIKHNLSSARPAKQESGFSAADIAEMKKRFEQKLAHDFPTRSDGQKTTLELVGAVIDGTLHYPPICHWENQHTQLCIS